MRSHNEDNNYKTSPENVIFTNNVACNDTHLTILTFLCHLMCKHIKPDEMGIKTTHTF